MPEEEIKRKPIKYRPHENADELIPENSNVPRRRNIKRRRRLLKRPMVEDYAATAEEENAEYINNTEEQNTENLTNVDTEELHEKNKIKIEYSNENYSQPENTAKIESNGMKALRNTTRKIQKKIKEKDSPHEISKVNFKIQYPTEENDQQKISMTDKYYKSQQNQSKDNILQISDGQEDQKSHNQNKMIEGTESVKLENYRSQSHRGNEMSKLFNEKRRNKPSLKNENITDEISKTDQTTIETSHTELETDIQKTNKNEIVKNIIKENSNKINFTENHKIKNEDQIKANDTNKKGIFKLRRLPPISAILRHVKIRPVKNETTSTTINVPIKSEFTNKLKDSTNDKILTDNITTEIQKVLQNHSEMSYRISENQVNITKIKELEPSISTTTINNSFTRDTSDNFEFPIIIYTEQKQLHKVISTTLTPSTSSTSTTENTAFIYIPCNRTTNTALTNDLNFTNLNNTMTVKKYSNLTQDQLKINENIRTINHFLIPITSIQNDSLSTLESHTTDKFGKLLERIKMETTNSNNSTKKLETDEFINVENSTRISPSFQQLDVKNPETHLNYFFRNKTNTNIPKLSFIKDLQELKYFSSEQNFREPKMFQNISKYQDETDDNRNEIAFGTKPYSVFPTELIITYTSTSNPNLGNNEKNPQEILFNEIELPLHLRNNSLRRKMSQDYMMHKKNHAERKKLPLAVKSAIIISGAILSLAVLGFFALLLSCKIRQARSRMKCHRELYREQFQNSEFRQSSRSTSPVVSKTNYNGRNFTNNIQSNVASNRNYYLWQTLRKTFQYD